MVEVISTKNYPDWASATIIRQRRKTIKYGIWSTVIGIFLDTTGCLSKLRDQVGKLRQGAWEGHFPPSAITLFRVECYQVKGSPAFLSCAAPDMVIQLPVHINNVRRISANWCKFWPYSLSARIQFFDCFWDTFCWPIEVLQGWGDDRSILIWFHSLNEKSC